MRTLITAVIGVLIVSALDLSLELWPTDQFYWKKVLYGTLWMIFGAFMNDAINRKK